MAFLTMRVGDNRQKGDKETGGAIGKAQGKKQFER